MQSEMLKTTSLLGLFFGTSIQVGKCFTLILLLCKKPDGIGMETQLN